MSNNNLISISNDISISNEEDDPEYGPFLYRLEMFLHNAINNLEQRVHEIEGLFVTDKEYRYRLRVGEGLHSHRITLDIIRQRYPNASFLDDSFHYYQQLYQQRILINLLNHFTYRNIAKELIEKMINIKTCQFCPRLILLSENVECTLCKYSYNFNDKCAICHEHKGQMVKLPNCNHRLHASCISRLQAKKCPICRSNF